MAISPAKLIDMGFEEDDQFTFKYNRTYRLYSTVGVYEADVLAALPIFMGQVHPEDSRSRCVSIKGRLANPHIMFYDRARNTGGFSPLLANGTQILQWTIEINWGPWSPFLHTTDGDPESQPYQVFFESQTKEEIVDIDKDGKPLVNSAYDYFDPPIMREVTRPIIRVVRNEASFSDSTILAYADKVNNAAVGPYPARSLKCSAPTGEPKYSQSAGVSYARVTYVLVFNENTWDKKIVDAGMNELDSSGTKKRRAFNRASMTPTDIPVFLNGSGVQLVPPIDDTNIVIKTFKIYDELDFSAAFGFPTGTFH